MKDRDATRFQNWIEQQEKLMKGEVVTDDCYAKQECVNEIIQGYANNCDGEESCKGATIESGIYCQGSKSCEESIIDNRGTTAYSHCEGYQACFRSDIKSTSYSGYFICSGLYSCGEATIQAEIITCYGKFSCARSDEINATDFITVEAYFGAARSTLYADEIRVYGHKGLFLSTVDSIGRDNLKIESYAHLGMDSASIICRDGSNCTLICATTGCKGAEYICENGAVCNIEPVECDGTRDAYQGIDCPTRTTIDDGDDYMEMKYELNGDIYKRFDEFMEECVVNYEDGDGLEEDDEYDINEMVFAGDVGMMSMERNVEKYSMVVFVIVVVGILIGFTVFIMCLWFRARDMKGEYESI